MLQSNKPTKGDELVRQSNNKSPKLPIAFHLSASALRSLSAQSWRRSESWRPGMRTLVLLAALTSLPAAAADPVLDVGSSTVVDLNAWDANNATTLFLGAGHYTFVPVAGAYTAWRPWTYVSGCDANGEWCKTGWVTSYRIVPALDAMIAFYPFRNATAEQALANTSASDLCLTEDQDVTTLIKDWPYTDNSGGLSIKITRHNRRCEASDYDLDGVDNDVDACPDFDDAIDADGDGRPDGCDVCPFDPDDDADGDGLCANFDACPNSPEDALIDNDGCAITDYCPCDGNWKSHDYYMECVLDTAKDFLDAGLIDSPGLESIELEAAQSGCGD